MLYRFPSRLGPGAVMRVGLYRSLTRACSTTSLVDSKLEQFTRTRPSPISIAEFIGTQKLLSI